MKWTINDAKKEKSILKKNHYIPTIMVVTGLCRLWYYSTTQKKDVRPELVISNLEGKNAAGISSNVSTMTVHNIMLCTTVLGNGLGNSGNPIIFNHNTHRP